jgi:predicted PurR-regulated permease PerM
MQNRVEQIAQLAAIVALITGCFVVLRPFVTALLFSAIVCYSTWPVYRWLERILNERRWLAALVMTLILVVVAIVPLTLLTLTFSDSLAAAADALRGIFAAGLPRPPDWIANLPLVGQSVDAWWRDLALDQAKLNELLKRLAPPVQEGLLRFGLILGDGVVQLSLAVFIGYFFYRDGAALVAAIRTALRRVAGRMEEELSHTVGDTIESVVYGLIGTAVGQSAVAAAGFLIAGVPGVFLLAFATFLLSLVPMGPPLIWGGAALWLVYHDRPGWALFMVLWGIFVISSIDNVIKPLLISRGSSLPFVLVFLGVLGGVVAFGFVGLFLGPTLLAVGFALMQKWTTLPAEPTPPGA